MTFRFSSIYILLLKGTLATMSPTERNAEPVEGIINSLIMRLLRRMFSALEGDGNYVILFFIHTSLLKTIFTF